MALIYKKGKPLEYTGMDKAMHSFGNVLEGLKSVGKKAVSSVKQRYANVEKYKASKELDDIARGFGTVENYEKLYPETKSRHEKLRKTAGR